MRALVILIVLRAMDVGDLAAVSLDATRVVGGISRAQILNLMTDRAMVIGICLVTSDVVGGTVASDLGLVSVDNIAMLLLTTHWRLWVAVSWELLWHRLTVSIILLGRHHAWMWLHVAIWWLGISWLRVHGIVTKLLRSWLHVWLTLCRSRWVGGVFSFLGFQLLK